MRLVYIGRVKLFPSKEFVIKTTLSVDEVKEKLKQLFDKKRESDFYNWSNYIVPSEKYYLGNYWGDEFYFINASPIEVRNPRDLFRDTTYTTYKGIIESKGTKTEIIITLKVGVFTESITYGNIMVSGVLLIWSIISKEGFIPLIISSILISLNILVVYILKKRFFITELFLTDYFQNKK